MLKVFVFTLVLPVLAMAGDSQSVLAIEQFNKVRQGINKMTFSQTPFCDTLVKSNDECTLRSMCSSLAVQDESLYLIRDRQNRSIPNSELLAKYQKYEYCLDDKQKPIVDDPFLFPEQFMSHTKAGSYQKMLANQQTIVRAYDRAEVIFNDVRGNIIKYLRSLKNETNSAQIENMIARLTLIKFERFDEKKILLDLHSFGCSQANASYKQSAGVIRVCPQMLNYPESSLFAILAHEFSHVIDPCNMTQVPPNASKNSSVIKKVSYKDNPLKSAVECLQSKESIGVDVPTKKEIFAAIDQEIKEAKADPNRAKYFSQDYYDKQKLEIENNYDDLRYCRLYSRNGHMQEAFSDWLSAQVLAEKIKTMQNPISKKEYAISSQGYFLSQGCDNITEQVENTFANIAAKSKCSSDVSISRGHSHPKHADRMNKIFLTHPTIRSAMGCKPLKQYKNCQ